MISLNSSLGPAKLPPAIISSRLFPTTKFEVEPPKGIPEEDNELSKLHGQWIVSSKVRDKWMAIILAPSAKLKLPGDPAAQLFDRAVASGYIPLGIIPSRKK